MSKSRVTEDGEVLYKEPNWKTNYNHNTLAEAKRTGQANNQPSMTQQHGAKDADINTIVDRFLKTGQLPNVPVPPTYENFGDIFDFQSAMNTIKNATDSFMALPAKTRSQFNNDPARFVGYVDHCLEVGDLEPLEKMGLALPKKPPAPPAPPPEPKGPKTPETPKEPPKGSKD